MYFLAHNGTSIFVPGVATAGQVVATGQPYLEQFSSLADLNIRLMALGQSSIADPGIPDPGIPVLTPP